MSGHRYVSNPNNLFEDEDVDDETFLKNSRINHSTNPFENEQQTMQEKREEIERRTLKSTQRSLGLLHETEEVGIATANELAKQREQLENTSRQLDELSSTLRFSQKHLNGLKSVFGGLKNYLSGNKDTLPHITKSDSKENIEKVDKNKKLISNDERYSTHPINRLRSDGDCYKEELGVTDSFNKQLDANLDCMSGSLSRMKYLALDLKEEIDTQNDLLDKMNYKIEDVDLKMAKQSRDMNKLLGKK